MHTPQIQNVVLEQKEPSQFIDNPRTKPEAVLPEKSEPRKKFCAGLQVSKLNIKKDDESTILDIKDKFLCDKQQIKPHKKIMNKVAKNFQLAQYSEENHALECIYKTLLRDVRMMLIRIFKQEFQTNVMDDKFTTSKENFKRSKMDIKEKMKLFILKIFGQAQLDFFDIDIDYFASRLGSLLDPKEMINFL